MRNKVTNIYYYFFFFQVAFSEELFLATGVVDRSPEKGRSIAGKRSETAKCRPVDGRPGSFRRTVEKQGRTVENCPETMFLCFSSFIPKQTRSQKVQGNPNNNKQAT